MTTTKPKPLFPKLAKHIADERIALKVATQMARCLEANMAQLISAGYTLSDAQHELMDMVSNISDGDEVEINYADWDDSGMADAHKTASQDLSKTYNLCRTQLLKAGIPTDYLTDLLDFAA